MIKIAVCDDDVAVLARMVALLNEYKADRGLELICQPFGDGLSLIEGMKNSKFSIAILDVLMPGFTGMEAAREIRGFDTGIKLIFLSASPEFAVESYCVDTYYYLLKPVSKPVLFALLDKAVAAVEDQNREGLVVERRSGILRIPYMALEVVEVIKKTVSFHLTDGTSHEIYSALSDVENDILARAEFVKPHRSFIVNMKHISLLSAKDLLRTNSGRVVPISKSRYADVREAYLRYLFIEKKVD